MVDARPRQDNRRRLHLGIKLGCGAVTILLLLVLWVAYTQIYRPLKGTVVDARAAQATYARVEMETSTGEARPLQVDPFVRVVEELAPQMEGLRELWGDGPREASGVVRALLQTFLLNRAMARLSLTHAQALEREGMSLQEYVDLSHAFQSIFMEKSKAGASGESFDCWRELRSGEYRYTKEISLLFSPSTSGDEVADVLPGRNRLDKFDRSRIMRLTDSWCRNQFEVLDISRVLQVVAQPDP